MPDVVSGVSVSDAGNAASLAHSLSGGAGTTSITGSVGGSDTDDFYKFVAPNTGTATFSLTGLSQDIDLRLLNSSGVEVNYSQGSGTSSEAFTYAVTGGQTYYVWVDPDYTAISNYSLSVSLPFAAPPDKVNGTSIADAGNTTSAAYSLGGSAGTTSITGSLGGTDTNDLYKFVAPNTGTATFSLTGLSQDIDLRLLNSSGVEVDNSSGSGTSNESFSYAVTAGQTYYVWVNPFDAAISNYSLSITLPSTPPTDKVNGTSIADAGNTTSAAYSLGGSAGTTSISGSVGGSDANDLYKFVAPNTGTATFSLTGLSQDIDLRLLNSSGVEVNYSEGSGTSSEAFTYAVTAGQTYYAWVDPFNSATSNYSLSVTLPAAPPAATPDKINGTSITDAGNTRSAAKSLSGSAGTTSITGSVGGSIDTDDYYTFVASNTGTATFSLTGLSSDIDLWLLNGAGAEVTHSGAWGSSSETVTQTVTAGQTYYLWVDPYYSAISNYSLSVTLPAAPPATTPDKVNGTSIPDAGNTPGAAKSVSGSAGTTSITGSVGGSDPDDYYTFVASNTGTATFALTGLSQDLDLKLLSSAGTEVNRSKEGGSSNESFSQTVTAGQTYYVWVDPYNAAISNYSLNVTLPAAPTAATPDKINGTSITDAGNTRSAAKSLSGSAGTTSITGSVGGSIDTDDYYTFVASNTGTATFALTGLSQDLDLKLLNSAGTEVNRSKEPYSSNESFSHTVTAGQTYYVWVDPYNAAISNYSLSVTLPAAPSAATPDKVNGTSIPDAGNTVGAAKSLSGSAGAFSITGSVGGSDASDYYTFVVPSAGTATFTLSGLSQDINLKLLNGLQWTLQLSESAGAGNETISQPVLAGQTYYLGVVPSNNAVSNYNLNVVLHWVAPPLATQQQSGVDAAFVIEIGTQFAILSYGDIELGSNAEAVGAVSSYIKTIDSGFDDDYRLYFKDNNVEGMKWTILGSAELGPSTVSSGSIVSNFTPDGLYNAYVTGLFQQTHTANGVVYGNSNALVATANGTLVLTFRGTDSKDSAFLNGQAWTGDGEYKHYEAFRPLIEAVLAYASDDSNGITRIVVSGHSLGGAMADIFTAVDAYRFAALPNSTLSVVSIASPGIDPDAFTDTNSNSFRSGGVNHYDTSVVQVTDSTFLFDTMELISPIATSGYYFGFAHNKDRVYDAWINDLGLGYIPNSTLIENVNFPATIISLPNIDNDDVDYGWSLAPDGFGAHHNGIIYNHDIQAIFGSPLQSLYVGQNIIVGVGTYFQGSGEHNVLGQGTYYASTGTRDWFEGSSINDTDIGLSNARGLDGTSLADFILGTEGDDQLFGNGGNDLLDGGPGSDTLVGGAGADVLAGGSGADAFRYLAASDFGDRIVDFLSGTDRIEVSSVTESTGPLAAGHFSASSSPQAIDGNPVFLYNTSTHVLAYDSNGSAVGGYFEILTLVGQTTLAASDIYTVHA